MFPLTELFRVLPNKIIKNHKGVGANLLKLFRTIYFAFKIIVFIITLNNKGGRKNKIENAAFR
jgi:hypothetical protein